jgi:hypothetical protein
MCKVNASKDARTATAPFIGTAFIGIALSSIHHTLQNNSLLYHRGHKMIKHLFTTNPIFQP